MIWTDSKELLLLYLSFFRRKVLNAGILKEKINKYFILSILFLVWFAVIFLSYSFFNSMIQLEENFTLIINFYALTTFIYSIVSFSFVKVLFLKSYDLLIITIQLPVSNKSRRNSLLLFEFIIVFSFVFGLISPLIIGFILKTNISFLTSILTNTVFVILTTYCVLNFFYHLFFYFFEKINVPLNHYFITILSLSLLLLVGINQYKKWGEHLISNYYGEKRQFILPLIFNNLSNKYTFTIAMGICFILNTLLLIFTSVISSNQVIENKKYFQITEKSIQSFNWKLAYVKRIFRLKENYLIFGLCLIAYAIGYLNHSIVSSDVFLLLTFNSLYSVTQTDKLRLLLKIHKIYSAKQEYLFLIVSNLLFSYLFSSPFIILEAFLVRDIKKLLLFILFAFVLVIYFTMISIMFPPTFDNPISITLGITITTIFSFLIVLIFIFLNLTQTAQVFSLFFLLIAIVVQSIRILSQYERNG